MNAALPATPPALAHWPELILAGHVVWVRTQDTSLYLAPQQPGHELGWGYRGGSTASRP